MSNTPESGQVECRYTPADLKGLIKAQLANLIRRQPDKWPFSSTFNPSKMQRGEMANLLLDVNHGFTKTVNSESITLPTPTIQNDKSTQLTQLEGSSFLVQTSSQTLGDPTSTSGGLGRGQDAPPCDPQPQAITLPALGDNGSTSPVSEPTDMVSVAIYIEDHRTIPHDKRVFKTNLIRAAIRESMGVGQDGVFVYARDVVKELFEHVHTKMQGPLEVGCPDPQDHDFVEYFYKFDDLGIPPIDGQHFNPELLLVDPKDKLYVHLKLAFPLSIKGQDVNDPLIDRSDHKLPGDLKPLEVVRARANLKDHRSQNRGRPYSAKKGEMAIWLRDEAENTTGYPRFKAGFHHTIQNPDIVFTWQFANDFYRLYRKTTFTSQLPSMSSRPCVQITRKAIQSALQVGETWLTQAIEAIEILDRYGPGGTNPSPGVVQELGTVRTPPRGRAYLLEFLRLASQNNGNVY
ncbi:hypothetical protein BDN72DRAFT_966063 [Pluteus cervinus]|uniref:Uncharacterized protein n=1 Tax=Pluteus cervinus TaxID=181527 RepID=A0ACD3A1G1_9AGAR|nr:hypothetical protein BDN72DRAFT_966063 [Pluteus cervinus]